MLKKNISLLKKIIKNLNILLSLLKYLNFSTKVSFLKPKQEELLIYDYLTGRILEKLINISEKNFIFTRKERINLYVLLTTITNKRDADKSFYFSYINNYIKAVTPKIILTVNDQDTNFWILKNFFPKIIFLVIQNSLTYDGENSVRLRLRESGNISENLVVDYLFLYSAGRFNEFTKYIKVKKKVIAIGSIKNNIYKYKKKESPNKIVYISQYKKTPSIIRNKIQYYIDKLLLNLLLNYCTKNNFKIFIFSKQKELFMSKIEEEYYNSILDKKNFIFIKEDNVYDVLDNYNFYVCIDSTLGYEALARGHKVAFFNYRTKYLAYKKNYYGFPLIKKRKGPFWTDSSNVKEFTRVMNFIVFSKKKEWDTLKKKFIKPIVEYDYGNKKLLKVLKKIIKSVKYKILLPT